MLDPELCGRLEDNLRLCAEDDHFSWTLGSDGRWQRVEGDVAHAMQRRLQNLATTAPRRRRAHEARPLMRIAALDLGSNSFHLIVGEARLDGTFVPLVREKEMFRLGDQVARTADRQGGGDRGDRGGGALPDDRRGDRVDEMIAVGTTAIREAEDGAHFVDRVRAETGVEIEVVDGVAEARLIFSAIRASVLIDPARARGGPRRRQPRARWSAISAA